jgi:hypothetical protein
MGGVVNGWNDVNDNNKAKTVMGSITVKPIMPLAIIENYIGGNEKTVGGGWRNLSDTVITYTVNPMVSVMGNVDYGRESFDSGASASWYGVAGYVKYQATPMVALIPRVEWFNDVNGLPTGAAQKLESATVTVELKAADNFFWRFEYRGDFSNVASFVDSSSSAKKNQQSFIIGGLYSFSTK